MSSDHDHCQGAEIMNRDFPPRFTRTVDLYGEEGFARLRQRGAVVVGLGGVGAHTVVALARSGIGRLKLIDFDRITVSSLNRHPVAGPADVGRLKTEVLAAWVHSICPDTMVEAVAAHVSCDNLHELVPLDERELFPVLVDCIDKLEDKADLLAHGVRHGWRTLASLGAAGKIDPGELRSGDLFDSRVCRLARVLRRKLRDREVGPGQVRAVWSLEAPVPPLEGAPGEGLPDEPDVQRRQPSNIMLPGMVGFALAAEATRMLTEG